MTDDDKLDQINEKLSRVLTILDGNTSEGGLVADHKDLKGSVKWLWRFFGGSGIIVIGKAITNYWKGP